MDTLFPRIEPKVRVDCVYSPNSVPRRAVCRAREPLPAQAAKVSEIQHVYEVRPRKDHRALI